jgi:hypothetical protein
MAFVLDIEISLIKLFFAGGNVRRLIDRCLLLDSMGFWDCCFTSMQYTLSFHQTSPDLLLDSAESYLVILTRNSYFYYLMIETRKMNQSLRIILYSMSTHSKDNEMKEPNSL